MARIPSFNSSYMVIIYAASSKQAAHGGMGRQKAAVLDSVEGWCAAGNLRDPGCRPDGWTDGR